jgi:hypothetical protein
LTSTPVQNDRPRPASTTARTVGSPATWAMQARIRAIIGPSKAFSASGRAIVRWATDPTTSSSTLNRPAPPG